jgi:cell division septation protein DedD
MRWKALALAILASQGIAFDAAAQARPGGPAEPPPPGFTGAQYVDSRGCAFVRAGYGGQVTWVRRLGSDRRPICGLQPTRVAMARAQAALAAEAQAPATAAPPPAAAPARVAPPPAAPPPVAARRPAPAAPAPAPGATQCPAHAPVAQRFELVGGGTIVLCLEPGVTITGARPGDPARPAGYVPGPGAQVVDPRVAPRVPATVVPRGYRLAWTDDRLNPQRGPRTAAGDLQMAALWTNEVPQVPVDDPRAAGNRPAPAPAVTMSTRSVSPASVAAASRAAPAAARAPVTAAAGAFVQVGSFGVPANARRAEARLAALGLPVRTVRAASGGRMLEIVRAGPFASTAEAQAALEAARAAGFGDAILRR